MIKHVWSVLCQRSVIDAERNTVSLLEVLEQITIQGENVPEKAAFLLPLSGELVTLWARGLPDEPCKGKAKVSLIDPQGVMLGHYEFEIDLSEYKRYRTRAQFAGLPSTGVGINRFLITLWNEGRREWDEVAEVPLEVCSAA